MRTIAVVNQKGGVGKTTITINLGATLARNGRRVLLVDLDPQGHCAVGLAVPDEQVDLSVMDVLRTQRSSERFELSQITWTINPNLKLAPTKPRNAELESELELLDPDHGLVRMMLEPEAGQHDFVILDCPPHAGPLMYNAICAADTVVIPVDTGYFSLHGLTLQIQTIENLAARTGHQPRVRIVANQYDVNTKVARDILSELKNRFNGMVCNSILNYSLMLREGASFGQPITEYAPTCPGAKDFDQLAAEFLAEEGESLPSRDSSDELVVHAEQLRTEADKLLAESVAKLPGRLMEPPARHRGESSAAAIEERLERIYGVVQLRDRIIFRTHQPAAQQVELAGDFNDWLPHVTPMNRVNDGGDYETAMQLAPGRYRYRVVVDGHWLPDPANPLSELTSHGEVNSIARVS